MTLDPGSYGKIGKMISEKRPEILGRWWERLLSTQAEAIQKIGEETAKKAATEILMRLGAALSAGGDRESAAFEELRAILVTLSATFQQRGLGAGEIASFVLALRGSLSGIARDACAGQEEWDDTAPVIDRVLDDLGITTFEAFAARLEEAMGEQHRALVETSVPVVKAWDSILLVPLIGILDSERTMRVMETLLGAIEETQSRVTILDISGIPAVDTLVARHLITTVSAVKLMGAQCIVTGISARIAQTMVQMGIDLGPVVTRSTMAEGLAYAFGLLGLRVTGEAR